MQKVLITGATGVLGRAIVAAAVDAGLAVRQGVRNLRRQIRKLKRCISITPIRDDNASA